MTACRRTGRDSGVMGSLVLVTLVLVILATGAIAVDIAHVEAIKTELQNACDAAALAGACDLVDNYENAEYSALSVAAVNTADGRPISNTSAGTLVTALAAAPEANEPGTVQVSARMSVNHLLAPIFGRSGDTVVATALAGSTGSIVNLYKEQAFPLSVSLDAVPKKDKDDTSGRPLYS